MALCPAKNRILVYDVLETQVVRASGCTTIIFRVAQGTLETD